MRERLYKDMKGLADLLGRPNPYRPDLLFKEWQRLARKLVVLYYTKAQPVPEREPVKPNRHERRKNLVLARREAAEQKRLAAWARLAEERRIARYESSSKPEVAKARKEEKAETQDAGVGEVSAYVVGDH